MKTFSYALVVHIFVNIATIAKCKYFERDINISRWRKTLAK